MRLLQRGSARSGTAHSLLGSLIIPSTVHESLMWSFPIPQPWTLYYRFDLMVVNFGLKTLVAIIASSPLSRHQGDDKASSSMIYEAK